MENNRHQRNATNRLEHARRAKGLRSDNTGFSFIDVMLALVILTIGVLALADLQIASSKGNTSVKSMVAAISVAETKMEQIRNTVYTNIVAEAPTQVTSSGLTFTRQVTVTTNSPMLNAKTVNVIVTWSDSAGAHTVPLATIVNQ